MPQKKKMPQTGDANFVEEMGEDFDKFETWVIEYRKHIIAICVFILLIVAAAVIGYQIHKASVAKEIHTLAASITKADLEKNLKIYPAGQYASAARFRLAMIYAQEKNYKAAALEYRKAAEDSNTLDFIRSRARLNSAYMNEKAGMKKEALAAFNQIASAPANALEVRIEASYAAGRLYADAGKTEEARKNFKFAARKTSGLDSLYITSAADPRANAAIGFWSYQAKNALNRLPAPAVKTKTAPAPKKSVKK